ncbi:uncharacterized protein EI90DRAFT_3041223 [Cantharellus anzutake]|uniref:uncharacterized protein n=1 Tax=Cantharellus anzutake TaxID=1750568 RepID=UPI001908FF05|nr:uncharacterized protein EI90DRAFT_3041223 [Cantharellus anzutake]KAF8337980.1 hypothetical protein EI90DRAFT_3041223 [Cantharellus anzutake]
MANGRLWDVSGNLKADGTMVHLFREKEYSLVEILRDPGADNQLFFIDYTGALCSKPTGHAIDIEDGRLVLRYRRPMTLPFPNSYSHPLPRFVYDPSTGHILVRFACDPSYPPPTENPSLAWKERQYLVTAVPMPKPPSLLANASQFLASAASKLTFTPENNPHGNREDFDLRHDEVLEEDRIEDEVDDDSPEHRRNMQIVSIPLLSNELREPGTNIGKRTRERRRWEIVPLHRERTKPRSSLPMNPNS